MEGSILPADVMLMLDVTSCVVPFSEADVTDAACERLHNTRRHGSITRDVPERA